MGYKFQRWAIGVANFNEDQLTVLMNEAETVPMANQFRSNPAARNRPLVEFCKENRILPIAHSPMNFPAGYMFDSKISYL